MVEGSASASQTVVSSTGQRWLLPSPPGEESHLLAQELQLAPSLAHLLIRRGIQTSSDALHFLAPPLDGLYDPFLLPDMASAVRTLLDAREQGRRILIHGDYDADGVTSTALLQRFLSGRGFNVTPFVPHRIKHGYGINPNTAEWAIEEGFDVVLTCDTGISEFEAVARLKDAGIKVVVTDHHEQKAELPVADAVVNPMRHDSKYPFRRLAGVGVAFKLGMALCQELNLPVDRYAQAYLDLVTIGTIADMMPLVDENRIMVHHGLKALRKTNKVGLANLLGSCLREYPGVVTSEDIGFKIGPRLNAPGRLDSPECPLGLLLTQDEAEAERFFKECEAINQTRKDQGAEVLESVMQRSDIADRAADDPSVIFIADEEIHPGLIGLIAGKLKDQFYRPTFLMTPTEGGLLKGSARSIPGFSLAEVLQAASPLLISGGGHAGAGGFALHKDRLSEFRGFLNEQAARLLRPDDLIRTIVIDEQVAAEELLDPQLSRAFAQFEPFGIQNERPIFVLLNQEIVDFFPLGQDPDNVKLKVRDIGGAINEVVAWRFGSRLEPHGRGARLDLVFQVENNVFRGRESNRLTLLDYRHRA